MNPTGRPPRAPRPRREAVARCPARSRSRRHACLQPASQFQSGLGRLELRRIEAGQRKQRVPVHRPLHVSARLGPLRRNRFEEREPAAMIEFYASSFPSRSAADPRGPRCPASAGRCETPAPVSASRSVDTRTPAATGDWVRTSFHLRRWLVRLLRCTSMRSLVPHEPERIVAPRVGVTELREGVPRFLRQDIRVVFGPHAIERTRSAGPSRTRPRCPRARAMTPATPHAQVNPAPSPPRRPSLATVFHQPPAPPPAGRHPAEAAETASAEDGRCAGSGRDIEGSRARSRDPAH